jgi:hypothetical protein
MVPRKDWEQQDMETYPKDLNVFFRGQTGESKMESPSNGQDLPDAAFKVWNEASR